MSLIKAVSALCRRNALQYTRNEFNFQTKLQGSCPFQCSGSLLQSSAKLSSYVPSTGPDELKLTSVRGASGGTVQSIWALGQLNHIAIAVPDLSAASAFYRDVLRAKVSEPEDLPSHGVTTVFVELENTKLELLHPLGDRSPIQKFLEKNKSGGLHHICIEVSDIEAAVRSVASAGVRRLAEKTSIGAHGKPVMFLHPADCNGVLVELEQK